MTLNLENTWFSLFGGFSTSNFDNPYSSYNFASAYSSGGFSGISSDSSPSPFYSTSFQLQQIFAQASGVDSQQGYPAIYGGTSAQAAQIDTILSAIPQNDRGAVQSINVGDNYTTAAFQVTGNGNGSQSNENYGEIFINSADLQDPQRAQYVVLHETGHAVAIHDGVLQGDKQSVWAEPDVYGDPVADHPGEQVNPSAETFADAYAAYYDGDAPALRAISPDEYNALATGAYTGIDNANSLDYITGRNNELGQDVYAPLEIYSLNQMTSTNELLFGPSWGSFVQQSMPYASSSAIYSGFAQDSFQTNSLFALLRISAATVNAGPPGGVTRY